MGSPTSAEELQAESQMRGRRQNLQHTNTIYRRCRKCGSYDVKDATIFDRMLYALYIFIFNLILFHIIVTIQFLGFSKVFHDCALESAVQKVKKVMLIFGSEEDIHQNLGVPPKP